MNSATKSANMHIRVNPEVRDKAMSVLSEIGISASDLFNLLLNQVAIQHKIPFELVDSTHFHAHDYSKMAPSPEDEYHTFDSWKEAKEWLRV